MRRLLLKWFGRVLPWLGAASAASIHFSRIQWPSKGVWERFPNLILWAIVTSAIVPLVQGAISEFVERRRGAELERENHIRALLVSSLVVLVRDCSAPWDQTGVQAFLVTGAFWWKRQVRVAKVRLAPAPSSGVKWTRNKGVIGRCWSLNAPLLTKLDQPPYSDLLAIQPEQWETVSEEHSYGLSFAEYRSLNGRYGTICAVPIVFENKYLGCVTFDTPPGITITNEGRAIESLAATAELVPRFL